MHRQEKREQLVEINVGQDCGQGGEEHFDQIFGLLHRDLSIPIQIQVVKSGQRHFVTEADQLEFNCN